MRYLLLGSAAMLALLLANAPQARAFDTQVDDSRNADGTYTFADPDEQLDAVADSAASGSGYSIRLPALDMGSGKQSVDTTDHSVAWTSDRIRLVFGPYAH
jgi:hypothetical protein